MIQTPSISVIVPVYRAEDYLERCVESLLSQTFPDFEILLVDDGSPDHSGAICDDYARKDDRIKVFHKLNGGVSSARQYGMDHAIGEYVIHADPDDWVESSMLEELYNKAKEEDADMVICDYYMNYENKQVYKKQEPSSLDHRTVLKELFQQLHGSCCNKLVRRACYNDTDTRFPEGFTLWEDRFVCCSLLLANLKVVYLGKAFYHYDRISNDNSLVAYPTKKGLYSIVQFIDYIEGKLPCPESTQIYFNLKCHAKEYSFLLKQSYAEFYGICKDINKYYVKNRKVSLLSLYVRMALIFNSSLYMILSTNYMFFKRMLLKIIRLISK